MNIETIMGKLPSVRGVEVQQSKTWSFKFYPYSWANFTINEGTGDFHVSSDWGSYSARWPAQINKMENFLAKTDSSYITKNLAQNRELSFQNQFDPDATEREIKSAVLNARRDYVLEPDDARRLCEDAESFVGGMDCDNCLDAMSDDLYMFLAEPWYYIVYNPSPRYIILRDWLIPLFQERLRKAA